LIFEKLNEQVSTINLLPTTFLHSTAEKRLKKTTTATAGFCNCRNKKNYCFS